jgi:uncharacterized repeat protein (TIGR03803 family)
MEACRPRRVAPILIAGAIVAAIARIAAAQTYEVVYPFPMTGGGVASEMILASDGRLYGVAYQGGPFSRGSVFALTPDGIGGYDYSELHAFTGPDGSGPVGSLFEAPNGNLYGTTIGGGAYDLGTVFFMDKTGRLTTIHSFSATGDDGYGANGQITLGPDGLLYGTSPRGGQFGFGCVFRIDAEDHVETIHSFTAAEGQTPSSGLTLGSDGLLYGTAHDGGAFNYGDVFHMAVDGQLTVVASFDSTNGSSPGGRLFLANDGHFYGTTWAGGDNNQGVLYRVDPPNSLVAVHSFGGVDGNGPHSSLVQTPDGKILGTTPGGGDGHGAVYSFDPLTSDFHHFHDFTEDEGVESDAGLVALPDGRLAGALAYGGPGLGNSGCLYTLDAASAFGFLYDFPGLEPGIPFAGLLEGADHNLYGTTAAGGTAGGYGTIFRSSLSGDVTTLHSFSFDDGYYVKGRLLRMPDGSLYGATDGNGFRDGNVFKLDGGGAFTVLHTFNGVDGSAPGAGLVTGADGKLYGTTAAGVLGFGTVYRIGASDSFEPVHTFLGTDGGTPQASLLLASDGNLYGTTAALTGAFGSVFRMDTSGNVTTVHTFQSTDGSGPAAELIEPSAGVFYGTTAAGGDFQSGTAFRMAIDGEITTLHSFAGGDGAQPQAGLVKGPDGAFYGTTTGGGPVGQGTLFKVTDDGDFTTLHFFHESGGITPSGTLVLASDGNVYGVAENLGAGFGVLFRLAMDNPQPTLDSVLPTSGRAAGGTSLDVHGAHLQPNAGVSIGKAAAPGIVAVDMTSVRAQSPALAPGSLNDVVVTNPDNSSASLTGAWFADFLDVTGNYPFHDFVESIFRAGITAGCGDGNFCPDAEVTREQMAVFLLKAEHGSDFVPPQCQGVFGDVTCTPGVGFPDWIEELYAEQITGGCQTDPLLYCPGRAVTRAEMAVFLLRTRHGTGYVPNPCAGIFADVPCPATPEFPYSDWIEQLYDDAITGGCAVGPLRYCPDNPNLRGEMAVFLTKTFLP